MTCIDRAEQRLEIARRLLGLPVGSDVLAEINKLPAEAMDSLKSQTNWVEEYEICEQKTTKVYPSTLLP